MCHVLYMHSDEDMSIPFSSTPTVRVGKELWCKLLLLETAESIVPLKQKALNVVYSMVYKYVYLNIYLLNLPLGYLCTSWRKQRTCVFSGVNVTKWFCNAQKFSMHLVSNKLCPNMI